jgi:hypothetical protein
MNPPVTSALAGLWSAVTSHRFDRLTDLPVRQARVQRAVEELNTDLRKAATSRPPEAETIPGTPKAPWSR